LYAGEFEKDAPELKARLEGQLVFNNIPRILKAAVGGLGIAHVPDGWAQRYPAKGRLERALEDWCTPWTGYHLYCPSCRWSSPAFASPVDALRHWH
jgi:DNA-binding transcriptional LysR family regulator